MTIVPHISVLCPSCYRTFRAAAWRVIPGGTARCSLCNHSWVWDQNRSEHHQLVSTAAAAKQRKGLTVAQAHRAPAQRMAPVAETPPSSFVPPDLPTLKERLDQLQRRVEELARRAS
jgi:hypothetical protein